VTWWGSCGLTALPSGGVGADRRFEDHQVGTTASFGPVTVTEEEILEFARRCDPQPFHTDPLAAKDGPFSGEPPIRDA